MYQNAIQLWSKSDFLDRARELKRRLEVWHIDDSGPVYCPREIVEFQTAIKSVFRNRVIHGEHDQHPTFTSQSIVGNSFIRSPKDPYAKWITIWEFRDFIEHLADAGDSEGAKLIRLAIERLLDSPMHTRARSQVFGDYVAGCEVDQSLLKDLLDAVTDCAEGRMMEAVTATEQPVAPGIEAEQVEARQEEQPVRLGRGRLKKEQSDLLRTQMQALLVAHPTMQENPALVASQLRVSESTARRWIDKLRTQYADGQK